MGLYKNITFNYMVTDEQEKNIPVPKERDGDHQEAQADRLRVQQENILSALSVDAGAEILLQVAREDEDAPIQLEKYRAQILDVLEGKEKKVDSEVVDRVQRDIDLATKVGRLEQGKQLDSDALSGVLERRVWGNFFHNLQKGDRIVSVLVPGADFLSIKYLNDKIFGPQVTNRIIEKKRVVLEEKIQAADPEAKPLQSDYKTEVFKLSKDSVIDMEKIMQVVDQEMKVFIVELTKHTIAEEKNADKHKVLKEFLDDVEGRSDRSKGKEGFRMNYGMAEVGGDDAKDQLLALGHALQTSRMAREAKDGSYGAEYSEASNLQEIENIKNLREEIMSNGNEIVDSDGNAFEIFTKQGDKFVFNRDLLRDVRKGKFKTRSAETLHVISLYIKKLNILDTVKPFTEKELVATKKSAGANHELAAKLRSGELLSEEDRKRAVEILRTNEKDAEFTSNSEFHKRAIEMDDAVYVSLDVLDLGVDLLLEYESALQDVEMAAEEDKLDKFNKASLVAGDITTEKLKDFRRKVAEVYKNKEFGLGEGLVVAEIGGDELTLAVNVGKDRPLHSKEKMDEFLFALKESTNSRVIKTVVSRAEKHVDGMVSDRAKVEAHVEAMKRAEQGAAIAKDVEEACRKLTRILKKQGVKAVYKKMDGLKKLFDVGTGAVTANIVVVENNGEFGISHVDKTSNKDQVDMSYEDAREELDKILGKNDKMGKDPDPASVNAVGEGEDDFNLRQAA
jgi:hypothetical protein